MRKFSKLFILEYTRDPYEHIIHKGSTTVKLYLPNLSARDESEVNNYRDFGLYHTIWYGGEYVNNIDSFMDEWHFHIKKIFDINNNINPHESICNFVDGVFNYSAKSIEGS